MFIKQNQRYAAALFFILCIVLITAACSRKTTPRSEREREGENEKYDGPEMIARMEYERTKNPATGRVPRERLLAAMKQTELSKQNALSRTDAVTALTWQERGPNSDVPGPSNGNTRANSGIAAGRVRAVMVDSTDATKKTVWVGSVAGGLWKTTDITVSPANWILVNDFLSNLAIADICQDPRPGFQNIMYFCTGESYYNIDAVQGNGVFKSTDGGTTWNYLASTSTYLNCTRIRCDFQGNIYLATRGTGLLRSTVASGGGAWTNITPAGLVSDICDMEISSTAVAGRLHVVAGIFTTQAYRYTDIPATVAAATWTAPAAAFPSFVMRAEIACSGSTLYALPANASYQVPTIYKSTNGGANWAATAGQPTAGWGAGQAWYNLSVAIDPSNANNCIVGTLDTWKTTNGGTTWSQISTWVGTTPVNQYVHADVHNITWYDGGNKLIFGCDGGIHYSSDKGVTIRDRNIGLRVKQFYSCAIHPSTTNYFLAGAQDNGVHQFSNAGLSSSVEVTGGDGAFVAIDQDQPQYQFGSYIFNDYRRSTDGGATWSAVTLNGSTGQFINPFDYDNTANIMYCSDAAGSYRRWTNPQTGSTSAVVSITGLGGGNVLALSVSPYTANRVYLGTDNGRVVQVDAANTIASGSAGTNISTGLPAGSVSCITQGSSDQNLIAVYSNYGINNIWVSTNGGTSWTACDGNLPDMPVRWALYYPGDNSKAYIATETGVWETTLLNGASTVWTANNTFPNVRTDMLEYRSSDRTIAAATHGRGLWTTVIPSVTTPDIQFQSAVASSPETTTFTSGCRGYTDYTVNMQILNAPTGAATVTLAVAGGATATQNVDYVITTNGNFASPSQVLTFASGVTTPQPVSVRIYDDAAVESAESFTLNYTISGTTNAQAGTSNQTFTFTITDNDVAPIVSFNASNAVGTYDANITSQTPFRSNQAKFRIQTLFTASELNAAGITTARNFTSMTLRVVTKNSTVPYTGFSISMANTTATGLSAGFISPVFTTVYPATNYSTVTGDNLFTFSTPFAWDGTSNVVIDFCFDNAAAAGLSDITEGTAVAVGTGIRVSTYSNAVVSTPCTSAAAFISDARIKATFGTSVTGTAISTALNNTKNVYLGPNDDVYFYDAAGAILARIKNLTAFDYGCTQVTIDRAGSSTAQFWNNATANYLLSKSCKVVPANNTAAGNYEITLYYTAAEVAGWEAATGRTWAGSTMQVTKVSNGFFVPDVSTAAPQVTNILLATGTKGTLGSNYTIRGSFSTTGFSGFGAGVPGNPQATANYRTKASGNFTDGLIWQFNNEGAGYADALQAPGADNNVLVQAPHTVALNTSYVSNTTKTLTVDGILNCGANTISGAGSFVLSAGATLGIGSAAGISASGATGNIQTTARTFPTTANYTYNGALNQAAGTGLPLTINNLVLANTGAAANNIVTLNSGLTVSGTSTLTSGILSIGANTLVLNGAASYSTGLFRGSASSNLQLTGNVGQIRFDQGTLPDRTINVFTVTGTGVGILGSPSLIANTFTLNPGGNFTVLTGNVLTVK
jgi:trimeric autotransporter adhesin